MFNMQEVMNQAGSSIDDSAKKVLLENEAFLKEMGKNAIKEVFQKIKDRNKEDLTAKLQEQMFLQLSPQDLLALKSESIDALQDQAKRNEKVKSIAASLIDNIKEDAAQILLTALLAA